MDLKAVPVVTAVFVPSENSQLHEQYKTIDVIHGTKEPCNSQFIQII